jgi:hypothetical protein
MPSFSLPYFVGKVPLSDGSWAHFGNCDKGSECFCGSQLQAVQKTQFSSVSEKWTEVKAACKEIHRDLNFFSTAHTFQLNTVYCRQRVMHGAYSLHYPVTSFTGQIFITYVYCCFRAVNISLFFLIVIFFLFLLRIFLSFYSASFMNPGNLEKSFMNTKA